MKVERSLVSSRAAGGAMSAEDCPTKVAHTSVSERQGAATTTATDRFSSILNS